MLATSFSRSQDGASGKRRTRRLGVIDVGSNSVRLVVHDVHGRFMSQRFNEKVLAGLGRDQMTTGRLHPEGVETAMLALKRFAAISRAQNVDEVLAFATAAVRASEDGGQFCKRVLDETGLTLRVLTGAEEAEMSANGVVVGFPNISAVVGDLGGSSLELACLERGEYKSGETFSLGPLAFSEIGAADSIEAEHEVRRVLERADFLKGQSDIFVAVGGAWRAIANVHMNLTNAPLRMMQNYEIECDELVELCEELIGGKAHADIVARVAKRRVETVPHAALVLKSLMELGGFERFLVSSFGVREGVVFETMTAEEREEDPLESGLDVLVASDQHGAEFGRALGDWVKEAAAYTLEPRLANAACRLVDVGALLHPDHRADLAFDLVARAPLPGLRFAGRAALALAIAARYKRNISNKISGELLDKETASKAKALGALMRLGGNFSGRSAALLRYSRLNCDGERLVLSVAPKHGALVSETVRRRLSQAASELSMEAVLELGSDF